MVKFRLTALALAVVLLLCGCGKERQVSAAQPTQPPRATVETTVPPPTEQTQPETVPAEPEITQPSHSALYLPGCSREQMMEYFAEVVLDMEYSDGTGDVTVVQKWLSPICYGVYGSPTDTDMANLERLCEDLNAIPGFPGIYPAESISQQNLSISFLDWSAFRDSFADVVHGEESDGAAQFWYYTATNELHTARIGVRTDLPQEKRSSVLPEEIINCLGITDTTLRPDSITYQYGSETTQLSPEDRVILSLLYDPAIQPGMDAAACEAIIAELYYEE